MFETGDVRGEWRLSAVEFDVLWRAAGRDRLPYPVQYRDATTTMDAARRSRAVAAQAVQDRLDEALHGALSILLDPLVRVEVFGFRGPEAEHVTRVHAGIRGETGVVLRQNPGADLEAGEDVHLAAMPARLVVAAVVDAVPREERGAGGRIGGRGGERVMRPVGEGGDLDDLLARPRAGVGEIGVHPGPAMDWRPDADGTVLHWVDVVDAGRYLVGDGAAEPVSAAELTGRLRAAVAGVAAGHAKTTSQTAT